jgi:hypothetical protein
VYQTLRQIQLDDTDRNEEFLNFVKHCHTGMLSFDVGASFGISGLAAAHFRDEAIAVDPSLVATRLIKIEAALDMRRYDECNRLSQTGITFREQGTVVQKSGRLAPRRTPCCIV